MPDPIPEPLPLAHASLQAADRTAVKKLLLDFVKPLAAGIARTFGLQCEVVVHDFSDPEHSIVWIEGNVTGRQVGGSVTEIGLAAIRGGDSQEDLIGYVKNTRDGRVLRSSTLMLRDPAGSVFGCLCINLDVTELVAFQGALGRLFPEGNANPTPAQFTDRTEEVLEQILEAAAAEVSRPPARMTREDRLSLMATLDRRGAFSFQRAVPTIAQHLGVSRTTIYAYLEEVRARAAQQLRSARSEDGHTESGVAP